MKKKLLAITLCILMTGSLAACGGSASSTATSTAASKAASTAASTAASAAASTAASTAAASTAASSATTGGVPAQFSSGWGDTNTAFDPLTVSDAITFDAMRQKYGAVPKSDTQVYLAANTRTNDNVYWTSLAKGYQAMADLCAKNGTANKIDIESALNESDTEGQLAVMKDQIRLGVNAIMISPISTSNCTEGVETAHSKNIPTIAVNNEFNGADMFIGPNSYEEGENAAVWANDNVKDGKCAIIMGLAGTDVVKNRTNGFKEKLTSLGSKIEVVDSQNADWDRDKAKDVAATFLKTYDDLKCIFCNNDVMALGAVEAVKETNKVLGKDIFVIGMDGTDEAYTSIKAGELSATVSMFPYYEGMMATEVTLRIMNGQTMPKVIWTPSICLDKDGLGKQDADLVGWTDPTFE